MSDWQHNQNLPANVRGGLAAFSERVQTKLGGKLSSLVAFGNIARGDAVDPQLGMVHAMLVLDAIDLDVLDQLAPLVKRGRVEFGLTLMLLTEDDLRTSADVFPIKFMDMKQHHIVLAGKDLLADLHIAKDHLRLRCEQQMKNLSLKLRSFYLHGAGQPAEMRQILEQTGTAFMENLRGYLCLLHDRAPLKESEVAERAAIEMGLNLAVLQQVVALKQPAQKVSSATIRTLFGQFMGCVEKAAGIVDAHQNAA